MGVRHFHVCRLYVLCPFRKVNAVAMTFYPKCRYNGRRHEAKKAIIKWAVDMVGIRAAARELGAGADTVIKEANTPAKSRACFCEPFKTVCFGSA
jgi:hypothetical protein